MKNMQKYIQLRRKSISLCHQKIAEPSNDSAKKAPPIEPDQVRSRFRQLLIDELSARVAEIQHEDTPKMRSAGEITKFAKLTEMEAFQMFNIGSKYRAKFHSLIFNIKDKKNERLFRQILEKQIEPKQLVRMTSQELASPELAEWRENEKNHQLEVIKNAELDLLACDKYYIFKSSNGERMMRSRASRVSLDLRTPVKDVVEALNMASEGSDTKELDSNVKGDDKKVIEKQRTLSESERKDFKKADDANRKKSEDKHKKERKGEKKVKEEKKEKKEKEEKKSKSKSSSKSRHRSKVVDSKKDKEEVTADSRKKHKNHKKHTNHERKERKKEEKVKKSEEKEYTMRRRSARIAEKLISESFKKQSHRKTSKPDCKKSKCEVKMKGNDEKGERKMSLKVNLKRCQKIWKIFQQKEAHTSKRGEQRHSRKWEQEDDKALTKLAKPVSPRARPILQRQRNVVGMLKVRKVSASSATSASKPKLERKSKATYEDPITDSEDDEDDNGYDENYSDAIQQALARASAPILPPPFPSEFLINLH